MKMTNHIVLWLSIVVIGFATLAYAIPHEAKDLKIDEKEFTIKELKIYAHGWKAEYQTKAEFLTTKHGQDGYVDQKWSDGFAGIQNSTHVQNTVTAIPEPSTVFMLGVGFVVLAAWHQRMRCTSGCET